LIIEKKDVNSDKEGETGERPGRGKKLTINLNVMIEIK
jgi:hypothetical protein